jgi:peptidoglycan/xylan/chitin deacetylase (PgdA/CDA1 family)
VRDTLALTYHAVSPSWSAGLSVRPDRFEAQMRDLLRLGYRGSTVSAAARDAGRGRTLVVTFDDSYRSVFRYAFPVLSRLGIPATVFVPTAYVGAEAPRAWPGMERWLGGSDEEELVPMNWDELAELAGAGWEIGSHTVTHAMLTRLDDVALERELRVSRAACEERLGGPCSSLAYPYGDENDRVVRAVAAAGYEVACTTPANLRSNDPLRWPRIGVYHDESRLTWRAKVSPSVRRVRRTAIWPPVARALLRLRGRDDGLPASNAPED